MGPRGPSRLATIVLCCLLAFIGLPRVHFFWAKKLIESALPPSFHTAVPPVQPSDIAPAPGWAGALPSCRVLDIPDDPLVIKYGHNNIRLSRTYEGSGARIRRVLRKALTGQGIKIAVVGGSVSYGHGLKTPLSHKNWYPARVHRWFSDTFPRAKHTLNRDSIMAGITAHYFSFCIGETLPPDTDLIIVELDVNQNTPHPHLLTATESLFRTLLDQPSQPAVIYLSTFGLVFEDMTHGWRHSALLTQWLDIPMINIRNFMLPPLLADARRIPRYFKSSINIVDTRHINILGHVALADMTIAYLREQLCLLQRPGLFEEPPESSLWPGNEITTTIPRLGMLHRYDNTSAWPITNPQCKTVASKKFPLKPLRQKDWKLVNLKDKKSWQATKKGATVSFEVEPREGLLGIILWKTQDPAFGQIKCWIDSEDDLQHVRVITGFIANYGASKFDYTGDIWQGIPEGRHELTCRIEEGAEGGTTFRISAVVER